MMTNIDTSVTRGKVLLNASLAKYNTWGVGGKAECIFQPADLEDLSGFLARNPENVPVTWLGLGSNVLIREGGISGIIIVTQGCINKIQIHDDSRVEAQAGVACAKLARTIVSKGLTGIEFMAGIPGTIGGALAMNAGAFGGQTWEHVISVDVINRNGEISSRSSDEYEFGYRYVKCFPEEWFVSALFQLKAAAGKVVSIKELLQQRADTQPIGKKNCGSVFKNPPGQFAAKLIEKCGLKGYAVGGACVSDKHANFILNDNKATASDIEELIIYIQKTVNDRCGVRLDPEVKILGVRENG